MLLEDVLQTPDGVNLTSTTRELHRFHLIFCLLHRLTLLDGLGLLKSMHLQRPVVRCPGRLCALDALARGSEVEAASSGQLWQQVLESSIRTALRRPWCLVTSPCCGSHVVLLHELLPTGSLGHSVLRGRVMQDGLVD